MAFRLFKLFVIVGLSFVLLPLPPLHGFGELVSPLSRMRQQINLLNQPNKELKQTFHPQNTLTFPGAGSVTSNAQITPKEGLSGEYSCVLPSDAHSLTFSGLQILVQTAPNSQYQVNGGASQSIPSSGVINIALSSSQGPNINFAVTVEGFTVFQLECNNPTYQGGSASPTTMPSASLSPSSSSPPSAPASVPPSLVPTLFPTLFPTFVPTFFPTVNPSTSLSTNALMLSHIQDGLYVCYLAPGVSFFDISGLNTLSSSSSPSSTPPHLQYEINGGIYQDVPMNGSLHIQLSSSMGPVLVLGFGHDNVVNIQITCNNPTYGSGGISNVTIPTVIPPTLPDYNQLLTPYITITPYPYTYYNNPLTPQGAWSAYLGSYMNYTDYNTSFDSTLFPVYRKYPCAVATHECFLYYNSTSLYWELKSSLYSNVSVLASGILSVSGVLFDSNLFSVGFAQFDICPMDLDSTSGGVLRLYFQDRNQTQTFVLSDADPYIDRYQHFQTPDCTKNGGSDDNSTNSVCYHIYFHYEYLTNNGTWIYDNDTEFNNGYNASTSTFNIYGSNDAWPASTTWILAGVENATMSTFVVCDFCVSDTARIMSTNVSTMFDAMYVLSENMQMNMNISLNHHTVHIGNCSNNTNTNDQGTGIIGMNPNSNSSNGTTCYIYSSGTSWILDTDLNITNGFGYFRVSDAWYAFVNHTNQSNGSSECSDNSCTKTYVCPNGQDRLTCAGPTTPCNMLCIREYSCQGDPCNECKAACLPSNNNATNLDPLPLMPLLYTNSSIQLTCM